MITKKSTASALMLSTSVTVVVPGVNMFSCAEAVKGLQNIRMKRILVMMMRMNMLPR